MATRFPILFKRLSDEARVPTRASENAAGWDLYSAERSPVLVAYGEVSLIKTDLSIIMPASTYGRIAPRSGLAVKHGIDTLAGVVDADFTGNITVVLTKHTEGQLYLYPGDRIAQIVFEQLAPVSGFKEVDELPNTQRGAKGFGSTGV